MSKKKRKPRSEPEGAPAAPGRGVIPESDFLCVDELEADDLDGFVMADGHAIRDLLRLDPNDIEFRQRHAETLDAA